MKETNISNFSLFGDNNHVNSNNFSKKENAITMNNYILGFNNDVNTNKTRTSKKIHEDDKNETFLNFIEELNTIIDIMIYTKDLYTKFSNNSLIKLKLGKPQTLTNNPKKNDIEKLNYYTINVKREISSKKRQKNIVIDEIYRYLQYSLEILYKYYKQNEKNIQTYFNTFSMVQRYSFLVPELNKDHIFHIYILNQLNDLEHPLLNYFLSIRSDLLYFDDYHSIIGALLLTIKALSFIIKKYIKFTITTNFLLTINTENYRKNFDMVILSLDEQFFNKVKKLSNKIPNHKKSSLVISNINETIKSMKHIQSMSKEKLEALQFFTNFSTKELKKLKKFGSNETLKYKVYKHMTGRPKQNTTNNFNKNEKKLKKRGFFRRTFNKFKSFKKKNNENTIKKRTMKNIENKNIQVVDKNLSIVEYLKNYEEINYFTDEDKNSILKLMDKSIKKQLFDMLSKH